MTTRDGDPLFDCQAIIEEMLTGQRYTDQPSVRASRWDLLWHDLLNRSRGLKTRGNLLKQGLLSLMPGDLRQERSIQTAPADQTVEMGQYSSRPNDSLRGQVAYTERGEKESRESWAFGSFAGLEADVVVLCVIEEEFNAAIVAFELTNERDRIWSVDGHSFLEAKLSITDGRTLVVFLGLLGSPRNVSAALFTRTILDRVHINLGCILVGIAAGAESELSHGDVVGAKMVWDIEGERVEAEARRPRVVPYSLRPPWNLVFPGFNPARAQWLRHWEPSVEELRLTGSIIPPTGELRPPRYRSGIIASGEKLRRDDPFPGLRERFGDEIVSIEMEGAGFAAACTQRSVDWFIFRGISDYADQNKTEEWHALAALNAALAARSFIESFLTRPPLPDEDIPL